jgi:hypothetical protein
MVTAIDHPTARFFNTVTLAALAPQRFRDQLGSACFFIGHTSGFLLRQVC